MEPTRNLIYSSGREIQRAYGVEPQCILTMPILEGTDGIEKMSKSLGNYISITDTPREIFGKTMSIPDNLIIRYFRYGAFALEDEIKALTLGLADGTIHPRNAKVDTAMRIVSRYHGEEAAKAAFEEFERIFVKKDKPDIIETKTLHLLQPKINLMDLLVELGLAPSKKEAKRKIEEGAVKFDDNLKNDAFEMIDFPNGVKYLIKYGKKTFLEVKNNWNVFDE